jgi:hypothetical protein
MPTHGHDRFHEEQRDRDRRYGLERDEQADFVLELELADRIADQASLPPGHHLARAAARRRLGRGPSPYERPREPAPQRFAPGEPVSHHGPDGPSGPGRVVCTHAHDGLVEVDFGQHGTTLVAADQLERKAA